MQTQIHHQFEPWFYVIGFGSPVEPEVSKFFIAGKRVSKFIQENAFSSQLTIILPSQE